MTQIDELNEFSKTLNDAGTHMDSEDIYPSLEAIEAACQKVGRAFCGSWIGYHSLVYYHDLSPPPAGVNFSQEWGLMSDVLGGRRNNPEWEQFDFDFVKNRIREIASDPDMDVAVDVSQKSKETFDVVKPEILSILTNEIEENRDDFLVTIKEKLENLEVLSPRKLLDRWSQTPSAVIRDVVAVNQGVMAPPHSEMLAELGSIRSAFLACKSAAAISERAARHIERRRGRGSPQIQMGTKVFIGHGGSPAWRELKDFIQDRLKLQWDEFNRVSVAGVPNTERLSQMLDAAAIALLVMTAEDEKASGAQQARMNVVHEAGLFQGRLGFSRAIILLEEGCEEFSNIEGLGQIRFRQGEISASFEDVRRVIEREGLLP